jgi:hypothetical protein
MNRKIKSVSFNLNDPFENEMYEYTERFPNFSSFIKRLIQNAMSGKSENLHLNKPVLKPQNEQVLINPEHLRQLI